MGIDLISIHFKGMFRARFKLGLWKNFFPGLVGVLFIGFPIAIVPAFAATGSIENIELVFKYFPGLAVGIDQAFTNTQCVSTMASVSRSVFFRVSQKQIPVFLGCKLPDCTTKFYGQVLCPLFCLTVGRAANKPLQSRRGAGSCHTK